MIQYDIIYDLEYQHKQIRVLVVWLGINSQSMGRQLAKLSNYNQINFPVALWELHWHADW